VAKHPGLDLVPFAGPGCASPTSGFTTWTDVEGWEPQVLAGARAFLAAGAIRAILCELNDYWLRSVGTSAEAFRSQLADEGFRDVARRDRNDALQTRLFLRQETE
jgi:hypothetical protein